MELTRALRAARRRLWLVVALPLLAGVVAAAVSAALPRVYEAQVGVLVRPAQPISSLDPNTAAVSADQVAATYSQLMTQRSLLEKVVTDLRLPMTADELSRAVSVAPQSNSTLLQVTVRDTSPARARDIANKLVDDFIGQTKQIQQTQVDQYSARMQGQVQQLLGQIQAEQATIDQLQAQGSPAHPLSASDQARLTNLQQQVTVDRSQYFQILGSVSDIEVNVARTMDSVIVISPAVAPVAPVSPKPLLNVALALAAGLVVAVGAAVLVDHLDQSIKTDAELTERTGMVPMTHIPLTARRKRAQEGQVPPGADPSVVEPYKTLRTNVLFSTLDHPRSTIVVTSAAPNEGKSVVSANFAAALAAAGHPTLLLDCDFRRPSQHRLFGRIRNVGLSDLMLGDVAEHEVLQAVDGVPNLWLVTSGRVPPNPTELLGSDRMRDILQRLQERFAHIVIDTPPVNAVADPLIVASHSRTTLFVVEQGRTSWVAARNAVQALERVGAHVLGAVVNKVVTAESHYAYYYRYGPEGDGGGNGHRNDKPDGAVVVAAGDGSQRR
jgi:capsular exopolysaccharide synthesis family protein